MRKAVTILITFILISVIIPLSIGSTEDEFEINVSVVAMSPERVYVGDTVSLTVQIENLSSSESEKLWAPIIFIDQELLNDDLLDYLTINEPEGVTVEYFGTAHPGKEIWPGDTVTGVLTFEIDEDAPGGLYLIPISLTGKRGPCNQGCHPWREHAIYYSINVIHGLPALSISCPENNEEIMGHTMTIDFSIKNLGSAEALNIDPYVVSDYSSMISQINIPGNKTNLQPNETLTGTLAIFTTTLDVGEYSVDLEVSFEDSKSKSYSQKKKVNFTISESNELTYEEMGDEASSTAQDYFDDQDYGNALCYFSKAKGFYELADSSEKIESSQTDIDNALASLEESLIPPPIPPENKNYLLLIGLAAGSIATLFGFIAGMARIKK